MEITASAVYDKNTIIKFTRSAILKSPVLWVITAVLVLLFALITVGNAGDFFSRIGTAALLVVLFAEYYFLVPWIRYKKQHTGADAKQEYRFTDEKIYITTKSGGISGSSEVEYSSVKRISENKTHFFIYISSGSALVVDKSTFVGGTSEDIKRKIG